MALACNIDARGKALRLASGFVLLFAAVLLAVFWAWPAAGRLPWLLPAVLAAAGAFQIFEGWAGWCALRAIGIRTRV